VIVPKHRFLGNQNAAIPLSGVNLVQITSMFQIDGPYDTATLMSQGGPGNFTWCETNPACLTGGALPGGQPAANNGRIRYIEGPNQFGGTMQMGARFGGLVSVPLGGGQVGFPIFGGSGSTLRKFVVGGGMNDVPTLEVLPLGRGYITIPDVFPLPGNLITDPGPFVTTLGGNTMTNPGGVKAKLPPITVGMTMTGQYTTNSAFPHTTGTVIVQQTTGTGGDDLFAVMGTDQRTAMGVGIINTVAGGFARRNVLTQFGVFRTRYGQWDEVALVISPKVPSISPAGLATAGILMLLAVGYALRRRFA
jgi:hypothetical protein